MLVIVEAACIVYITGCVLAVAVDLWLHHSFGTPRTLREDVQATSESRHP